MPKISLFSRRTLFFSLICLLLFITYKLSLRKHPKVVDTSTSFSPCLLLRGELEYGYKAGCQGDMVAGSHVPVKISFNSRGLRDAEHAAFPEKHVIRILVFGGSDVVGVGLSRENTLPVLLEAELSAKLKKKVEVINGATIGYCGWQNSFRGRELIEAYHPDLVVHIVKVPLCLLWDGAWERRIQFNDRHDPVFVDRSILGRDSILSGLNGLAYRNFSVFMFLHTIQDEFFHISQAWRIKLSGANHPDLKFGATVRIIDYMKAISSETRASFVPVLMWNGTGSFIRLHEKSVMYYGVSSFFTFLFPEVGFDGNRFAKFLEGNGIDPILIHSSDDQREQIPGDIHLSEYGQSVAAKEIATQLLEHSPLREISRKRR